ncbi:hypothetical protein [Mesorhizobium sp. L-8-3]|uniref:hypothetical protein n=1 Tax=Mesorhizobium sp. L-8-3 TaxID=2744522 RepID=UPI0019259DC8|nr:hypothetical protein [Mesorhizobium sp. L-8-3]BCH24434.1 hypothetical protein MesoLjLb_42190 [Mesorhizobium sp. L-8-3]
MILTGLHALAADRGDGLRPELLALLAARQGDRSGGGVVVELASRRGDAFTQSGPHPRGLRDAPLPKGVVRFPARTKR